MGFVFLSPESEAHHNRLLQRGPNQPHGRRRWFRTTPDKHPCVVCGWGKQDCCDTEHRVHRDGTESSRDPHCWDCCPIHGEKHRKAVQP